MIKYPNYEFNEAQNKIFAALAGRILIFGVILVIIGVPLVAMFVKGDLVALSVGSLYIITGLLSFNAYSSFKKIIATSQNDITYLMDALQNLTNMYTMQLIAFVAAAIAFIVFEWKLL